MGKITLFVISDLHAFDGSKCASNEAPSFYDISKQGIETNNNPIYDLKSLIVSQSGQLKSDYLICCGDLGDKAYPAATERAWQEVQEIGKLLEVKSIIATVGNHDVDSRYKHNDHDAKGVLLELKPGFPFKDEVHNCHFWTHHFATFTDKDHPVRFVVLNSSAYHGDKDGEYIHGRVSTRTLNRLKNDLLKGPKPFLNVLICHHHPHKHSELNLGDYDDMKGGYELLTLLDAAQFGPWVIFHGHKHHPKICYSQGGNLTPVVFSVGSCAAIIGPELVGHARNQAYLVKIQIPALPSTNCVGNFISWDWAPGRGWDKSQAGSGLPARGGFGYRGDIGHLASSIAKQFPNGGRWKDVLTQKGEIGNLLPTDCNQLCNILKNDYNYSFELGMDGNPILFDK